MIKKMKICGLALFITWIFFSCNTNYEELNYPDQVGRKVSARPTASILSTEDRITITWTPHKDATGYELYRNTDANGISSEPIYSGTDLSFTDKAPVINSNKFYYYRIKAISQTINYNTSDASPGLFSPEASSLTNKTENTAQVLLLDEFTSLSFYTFYDNANILRTSTSYYAYTPVSEHDAKDLIIYASLEAKTPVAGSKQTIKNSVIYIQYIAGNRTSISYPLLMGGQTKLKLPQTTETIYIKISSNIADYLLTQDVDTFPLQVTHETLSRKTIKAEAEGNHIKVSWDMNPGETKYDIYRKVNTGAVVFAGWVALQNFYLDNAVSAGNNYQYYLLVYHDDLSVEESELSNSAYLPTGEYRIDDSSLNASVLGYKNSIQLRWNNKAGVNEYAVYRYLSQADTNPVRFQVSANSFTDTTCTPGTPYLYKVACLVNNREYLPNAQFAFGLSYSLIDYFEPDNDDIARMRDESTSVFDEDNPPVIYSVADGLGGTKKDRDFYKYRGSPEMQTVIITLPADTPFKAGELTFRWYYNGSYNGDELDIVPPGLGINDFTFDDFVVTTGTVDLYWEIIINTPANENKIGKYKVELREGL